MLCSLDNENFMIRNSFYRDWREVTVRRKQRSVELKNLGRQDDSFTIVNRYPLPNNGGDDASLLLKKGNFIASDIDANYFIYTKTYE